MLLIRLDTTGVCLCLRCFQRVLLYIYIMRIIRWFYLFQNESDLFGKIITEKKISKNDEVMNATYEDKKL